MGLLARNDWATIDVGGLDVRPMKGGDAMFQRHLRSSHCWRARVSCTNMHKRAAKGSSRLGYGRPLASGCGEGCSSRLFHLSTRRMLRRRLLQESPGVQCSKASRPLLAVVPVPPATLPPLPRLLSQVLSIGSCAVDHQFRLSLTTVFRLAASFGPAFLLDQAANSQLANPQQGRHTVCFWFTWSLSIIVL
jgi:hypothetical protein